MCRSLCNKEDRTWTMIKLIIQTLLILSLLSITNSTTFKFNSVELEGYRVCMPCHAGGLCHKHLPGLAQGVTTSGLSSLASFLKILSSKHVCSVFRDIRDKNSVNQGFWNKTAVFSLPATKVDCLLIFWLPHLYNLLRIED